MTAANTNGLQQVQDVFTLLEVKQNAAFSSQDHIVLLTFDDNYLFQSINLIQSIAKYHPCGVSFICTCPKLSQESMDTLMALPQGIQVMCYQFSLNFEMGRWAISAVLRLFCSWLLGKDIHRVHYMDSDILCTGKLDTLFESEIPCIAMCNEISGNVNNYQQEVIRPRIGTRIYCNSGVVVFNLDYIRANYSFHDVFTALCNYNGVLHYLDQDFLNIFFQDKIVIMNAFQYNCQIYELLGTNYYKRALKHCRLIHFSVGKPWIYVTHPRYIRLYLQHSVYAPMIQKIRKVYVKSLLWSPIREARHMLSPLKQAWLAKNKK